MSEKWLLKKVAANDMTSAATRLDSNQREFACCASAPALRLMSAVLAASSQAPYPSLRRKRQSSLIALLVLSSQQPRRWVAVMDMRQPNSMTTRGRWFEQHRGLHANIKKETVFR